jgi:biopolymer transport protein ExbB/TolQ
MKLRLPWLLILLAAFVTGSRADRLIRAIPGYLFTVLVGWAITAYACYAPANHVLIPLDAKPANDVLNLVAANLPQKARGLRVEHDAAVGSLVIFVTDPAKAQDRQEIARIEVTVQSHVLRGELREADKISVRAHGQKGSDPKAKLTEIVLFERAVERPTALFSTTHAVQLPASTHALQKALTAFLVGLPESSAVKRENLSLDTSLLEEQAKAIGEEMKGLERLGSDFNWNRRINGKIQFLTVWAFWVAMLQMGARFLLHSFVERRIRQNELLQDLWDDPSDSLNDEVIRRRSDLCDEARKQLSSWGVFGTYARSAYLELYHAAIAAFKVEGDYKSVPTFVDSQAATLSDERNAGMGFIKYLIWSIPSLGFVGTVVGIGDALLETVNVDSLDVGQAAIAKSMVSSNIGVAFDTTLVALLLSLVSMLVYHLLLQFENLTVHRATSDAITRFVKPGKAISESQLASDLVQAIQNANDAAKRFNRAGVSWKSFNDTLSTVIGQMSAQKRLLVIQVVIIVLMLGILGWQTWHVFARK